MWNVLCTEHLLKLQRSSWYEFSLPVISLDCCCTWVLRHYLTSQVISVAFYIEREKSNKFCPEALVSAWGSFTCRKSTTGDQRLYFPSEGSHTQDFYAVKKINRPRPGLNPRTSDPVANMITTGPPGSTTSLERLRGCTIGYDRTSTLPCLYHS